MFLILTFAYLMGSIPFGKLITKFLTNKDITKTGSGNIGATNVYRSVSKKAGIAVLLLDGIKPICAFLIIYYLFPEHYLKYKYLIFLFCKPLQISLPINPDEPIIKNLFSFLIWNWSRKR